MVASLMACLVRATTISSKMRLTVLSTTMSLLCTKEQALINQVLSCRRQETIRLCTGRLLQPYSASPIANSSPPLLLP